MENITKLLELNAKGLLTDEELASSIKDVYANSKKEKTWEEKRDDLVQETRNHSQKLKDKIELRDIEREFSVEREDTYVFLASLTNHFGEKTYSIDDLKKMDYSEAQNLVNEIKLHGGYNQVELTNKELIEISKISKSNEDKKEDIIPEIVEETKTEIVTPETVEIEEKEEPIEENSIELKAEDASDDIMKKFTGASDLEKDDKTTQNKAPLNVDSEAVAKLKNDLTAEAKKIPVSIKNIPNWMISHPKVAIGGIAAVVALVTLISSGLGAAIISSIPTLAAGYVGYKSTFGKK